MAQYFQGLGDIGLNRLHAVFDDETGQFAVSGKSFCFTVKLERGTDYGDLFNINAKDVSDFSGDKLTALFLSGAHLNVNRINARAQWHASMLVINDMALCLYCHAIEDDGKTVWFDPSSARFAIVDNRGRIVMADSAF